MNDEEEYKCRISPNFLLSATKNNVDNKIDKEKSKICCLLAWLSPFSTPETKEKALYFLFHLIVDNCKTFEELSLFFQVIEKNNQKNKDYFQKFIIKFADFEEKRKFFFSSFKRLNIQFSEKVQMKVKEKKEELEKQKNKIIDHFKRNKENIKPLEPINLESSPKEGNIDYYLINKKWAEKYNKFLENRTEDLYPGEIDNINPVLDEQTWDDDEETKKLTHLEKIKKLNENDYCYLEKEAWDNLKSKFNANLAIIKSSIKPEEYIKLKLLILNSELKKKTILTIKTIYIKKNSDFNDLLNKVNNILNINQRSSEYENLKFNHFIYYLDGEKKSSIEKLMEIMYAYYMDLPHFLYNPEKIKKIYEDEKIETKPQKAIFIIESIPKTEFSSKKKEEFLKKKKKNVCNFCGDKKIDKDLETIFKVFSMKNLYCSLNCYNNDNFYKNFHEKFYKFYHPNYTVKKLLSKEDKIFLSKEDKINPDRGKIGLINIGQTCYMNSGLQCIIHSTFLLMYILREVSKYEMKGKIDTENLTFRECFISFLNEYWFNPPSNGKISPKILKKAFGNIEGKFDDNKQHDSPEFIVDFLNTLGNSYLRDNEFKNIYNPNKNTKEYWEFLVQSDRNIIKDLFYFLVRKEEIYECKSDSTDGLLTPKDDNFRIKCKKEKSVSYELFLSLGLNFPRPTIIKVSRFLNSKGEVVDKDFVFSDKKEKSGKENLREEHNFGILEFKFKVNESYDRLLYLFEVKLSEDEGVLKNTVKKYIFEREEKRKREKTERILFEKDSKNLNVFIVFFNDSEDNEDNNQKNFSFHLSTKMPEKIYNFVVERFNIEKDSTVKDLFNLIKDEKENNKFTSLEEEPLYLLYKDQIFDDSLILFKYKESLEKKNRCFSKIEVSEGPVGEGHELYQCFNKFKENKAVRTCRNCGAPIRLITEICKPPFYLMIHLKKFVQKEGELKKLNEKVKYDEEIDITEYCVSKEHKLIYELYGVICHIGTLNSGHYYCHVKVNNEWKSFNDHRVSDCKEIIDKNALVLFYRLKDPKGYPFFLEKN